jgi:hypothetical protein
VSAAVTATTEKAAPLAVLAESTEALVYEVYAICDRDEEGAELKEKNTLKKPTFTENKKRELKSKNERKRFRNSNTLKLYHGTDNNPYNFLNLVYYLYEYI